jgi:hypothetical protein
MESMLTYPRSARPVLSDPIRTSPLSTLLQPPLTPRLRYPGNFSAIFDKTYGPRPPIPHPLSSLTTMCR